MTDDVQSMCLDFNGAANEEAAYGEGIKTMRLIKAKRNLACFFKSTRSDKLLKTLGSSFLDHLPSKETVASMP